MTSPQPNPIARPVHSRSVRAQVNAVRSRIVSAQDSAGAVRTLIEDREVELRAWVGFSPAIETDAREVDRRISDAGDSLPLAGLSVGVKDLIDVAGMPTRAGSDITSDEPAALDAPCVDRLRTLGAVIQGKTVTTEFGYFRPGATRNPHAVDHTPGGSSSGSAAAVGSGTLPFALGTQTAGSLTRPASFCGAAAMVLAHGSTDTSGITGLSPSLDSLGLLTRTITDLQYVYEAFTGKPLAVPAVAGVEVRLWSGSSLDTLSAHMRHLLDTLPVVLGEVGVTTTALQRDDHIRTLTDDQVAVMAYEASRTRAAEARDHADRLSTSLLELLRTGAGVSTDSYRAALVRRDRSRTMVADSLGDHAVIVGPAALGPAPKGLGATGSPVLSRAWQLLGCPVITVPGARTDDGMPLGLQVIGVGGGEGAIFAVARALEQRLGSTVV
ncbi:amidase [Tsukamurella asaccharolytica]|uniref:amidase n=1 Tax=Tsukamurella asaccharolytica TaxID=2592067 RepID=UPI001E5AD69F|nr:amidase [Tsukamurella asaccharolytica]